MKRLCVGLEVGESSDNRLYCLVFCQHFNACSLCGLRVDGTKIAGRVDYKAGNLVALFHRREIAETVVHGQAAGSILHVDVFSVDSRYDGFTGVFVVGVVVGRLCFQRGNVGNVSRRHCCPKDGKGYHIGILRVEHDCFLIDVFVGRSEGNGQIVAF